MPILLLCLFNAENRLEIEYKFELKTTGVELLKVYFRLDLSTKRPVVSSKSSLRMSLVMPSPTQTHQEEKDTKTPVLNSLLNYLEHQNS